MRVPVFCATAILLALTRLTAQTPPSWRYTATAPIGFFRVTPLGNVVVATGDGLLSLHPDSGTVIWRRDDLGNVESVRYAAVRQTPFATVQVGERFELIDLVTGATRWSTPPRAHLESYLPIPEGGLLLAYGSNDSLEHVLVALDLETGVVRWERVQTFKVGKDSAGPQPALWVSDSTFLIFIPKHGPVLVRAGTGEWVWGADKLEGWRPYLLRPFWWRNARMLLDDSVVYVPFDNRLQAVRTRDGAPLWAEPLRFPTPIAQFELAAQGLAVRGQPGHTDKSWLDLIDPSTGASLWRKQVRGLKHVTPFVLGDDRVYVAANGKLLAVSLDDGTATELARLRFRGDERPFLLERRAGGLLLISNQNLMLLDTTGAQRYHAYHPAPGRSTLAKVGLAPIAVVGTVVNVASDVAYCFLDNDSMSCVEPPGPNLFLPSVRMGGLGYVGIDRIPVPNLGVRYAASEQARNYVYSVAHEADSTGHKRPVFLRLHKDDGRVVGRVWLEEKRPEYQLDPIAAILYVREGREILAFRM